MNMHFGINFIILYWFCCLSQYMSDNLSCKMSLYDDKTKISASSILDNNPNYQPEKAKMMSMTTVSNPKQAWCPQNKVANAHKEWFMVEFGELNYVYILATSGRTDGNYGQSVKQFLFQYQRTENLTDKWYTYRPPSKIKATHCIGNLDFKYINIVKIKSPTVIRRIRIIPIEFDTPSKVCLKFGAFGCPYRDSLKEYQMPQGDSINLYDNAYDGNRELKPRALLTGGLGCLTDSLYDKQSDMVCKVGWKRKTDEKYIDIDFIFTSTRKFNHVLLYPAFDSSLPIELMDKLDIVFYDVNNSNRIKKKQMETPISKSEVPIKINLENNLGNFIKLRLYFKSDWMGLSEIIFDSQEWMQTPNKPDLIVSSSNPILSSSTSIPTVLPYSDLNYITIGLCFIGAVILTASIVLICCICIREWNKRHNRFKFSKMWLSHNANNSTNPTANTFLSSHGASQSMHHLMAPTSTTKFIPTLSGSTSNPNNLCRSMSPYVFDPMNQVALRYPTNDTKQSHSNYLNTLLPPHVEPIRISPSTQQLSNDYEEFDCNTMKTGFSKNEPFLRSNYNNQQSDLINSLSPYPPPPLPVLPPPNPYNNNTTDSSYSSIHYSRPTSEVNSIAAPDLITIPSIISMNESVLVNNNNNNSNNFNSKFPHKSIQGVFGSTMTLLDKFDGSRRLLDEKDIVYACPEISDSCVQLTETLVEGSLGCKLDGYYAASIDEMLDESGIEVGHNYSAKEQRVIVMKPKCHFSSVNERIDYYREISYLLKSTSSPVNSDSDYPSKPILLHQNLPIILGSFVVNDLMESEDIRGLVLSVPNNSNNLVNFFEKIRRQPPQSSKNGANFMCNHITHTSLLYMAQQLANCMHYLTTELGLVHRDLAARNIHVSEGFQIILHDSSIGAEVFSNDYCLLPALTNQNQSDVCKLPIRWMAWEAITMSSYSPKSDIWSFGVVLWEMLTECQTMPYSCFPITSDNSQTGVHSLLHNSTLIANNHPASILPNCRSLEMTATHLSLVQDNNQLDSGKAIQQLMCQCWTPDPSMRPTFSQLNETLLKLYQLVGMSTNKKPKNNNNCDRPHSYQLYKQSDDFTKPIINS